MVVVVLCTYIIDSKIFETTIPGRPPPSPNSMSGDRMGGEIVYDDDVGFYWAFFSS